MNVRISNTVLSVNVHDVSDVMWLTRLSTSLYIAALTFHRFYVMQVASSCQCLHSLYTNGNADISVYYCTTIQSVATQGCSDSSEAVWKVQVRVFDACCISLAQLGVQTVCIGNNTCLCVRMNFQHSYNAASSVYVMYRRAHYMCAMLWCKCAYAACLTLVFCFLPLPMYVHSTYVHLPAIVLK